MIFRIRLPRLEELIGLGSDEGSWHDLAKPKTPQDHQDLRCTCYCLFWTDTNTVFTAYWDQTNEHSHD